MTFTWVAPPRNLFLINNPTTGDFTATLKIDSFVLNMVNYAQIDVIALDDTLDLVPALTAISAQTPGPVGQGSRKSSWIPSKPYAQSPAPARFYLRLTKISTNYSQSYSLDGANYTQVNTNITFGNGMPKHLGFCAGDDPLPGFDAVYIEFVHGERGAAAHRSHFHCPSGSYCRFRGATTTAEAVSVLIHRQPVQPQLDECRVGNHGDKQPGHQRV